MYVSSLAETFSSCRKRYYQYKQLFPHNAVTEDIQKYDFIDALRGYAMLMVILVHSSLFVAPVSRPLEILMHFGVNGMQLFFIVSAWTLCMSWQARSVHEMSPVRNFFIRRFFRIAPMFYLAIVFYVILYGFSPRYFAPNGIQWWFIPLTVLFSHGFHPETINSVVPGGWSIAIEVNFYLILPFLLRRITTIKSSVYFFIFSMGIYVVTSPVFEYLLAGGYPPHQQYLISNFNFMNFFHQLPVFAIGIAAYLIYDHATFLKRILMIFNFLLILWLLLLMFLPSSSIFNQLSGNNIFIAAVLALVAVTLRVFPLKILVNKVIMFFGKISLSIYLTHFAVLHYFSQLGVDILFNGGDAASILYCLCVIAVTVPLAYVFYITVERWGISMGKRLIDKLEQRDAHERTLRP